MNRLKYFRKKAGKTQAEIAALLNLTQTAYGNYELGKRDISTDNLSLLASYYGVTADALLGREPVDDIGKRFEEKVEIAQEDEARIPLVASLRCGPGEAGRPFSFVKTVAVPKSFIRRWGEGLCAVIAIGESMSPTIIPGDLLICRPGEGWTDGDIISANLDDTDMIKRIYRAEDGGIDLKSDNPKFNTIRITGEEINDGRLHILGRVMIAISEEL